jgi:hypothetical protein
VSRKLTRDLLVVVWIVAACGSPTAPDRSVEEHIRSFIGGGATDCGRLGVTATDPEMQTALTCALDAARRGVAFSVVRRYQGIDSSVAEGLMAKAGGATVKFFYDSAPCGGPNCGESFTTQPCASPHLSTQSGRTVFACGAPEHP